MEAISSELRSIGDEEKLWTLVSSERQLRDQKTKKFRNYFKYFKFISFIEILRIDLIHFVEELAGLICVAMERRPWLRSAVPHNSFFLV